MFGNAESYELFMGRWSRLIAPLLLSFADVPESARVLDVGSGTGSLARAVAENRSLCHVFGIDPSREYIEYANARNLFPDRVAFEVGDAQQLRFSDGTFQATLSLLVFSFIPNREKALREVRRVTQPGGQISAAIWDYSAGMRMLRVFWDVVVSLDAGVDIRDERHLPLCRAGELAQLWRQAGLENVQEQPIDITMDFESLADYWDPFLLGQGPAGTYIQSISDDRLQVIRDEVKRRLPITRDDMAFALPARAWAVRGTVPS